MLILSRFIKHINIANKEKKIKKTSIICYNNQKATTFSEKSEIFLQTLLSNSAELAATASFTTDISYSMSASYSNPTENQWNWPELTENELEKALFFCSAKKTSDSD